MKKQITTIVLGAVLAVAMAAPSFAQGNGGGAAPHATHHKKAPVSSYSGYSGYSDYYDTGAAPSGYSISGSIGGIGR
jgi:hypothetical protein